MKINKNWLVGFVDGEGCFYIGINKSNDLKIGYQVLPEFRIVQHKIDVQLLYSIKDFFGHGRVVYNKNKGDNIMEYRVRKLDTLLNIIVPFFEKNQLQSKKKLDFLIFRDVVLMMKEGKHLTSYGLQEIINKKKQMNKRDKDKEIVRS